MKIERISNVTSSDLQFLMTIESFTKQAILDATTEAIHEIAKQYVDSHLDKIMAEIDLRGLANLIAIYASKKLAEDIKR